MLSPDQCWYWNGQAWMAVPPARDSATWWSEAPDWMLPVLLNGLILLIPIVGQIVVYGWVLAARDELRAGRNLVPPASFVYISRGTRPFLALLIWGLYYAAVWLVLGGAGAGVVTLAINGAGILPALALLLGGIAVVVWLATLVLQLVTIVPIIAISDEVGLGPAINPGYVWEIMRAYPSEVRRSAAVYLLGIVASIALGLLCSCLIVAGVFATAATLLSLAAPLARVQLTAPAAH